MAKKMFMESMSDKSKLLHLLQVKNSDWPLLEKAFQKGCLSYADLALSKRLLKVIPQANEEAAALLCHLSASSRKGHLCIRVAEGKIYPSVESIWRVGNEVDDSTSEMACLWQTITEKIMAGCETIDPLVVGSAASVPVFRYENFYYLQRYWKLETSFIEYLTLLIVNNRPEIQFLENEIEQKVNQLLSINLVLKEQAQAILQGCSRLFTIITGGPGTGKTHTAGLLVKVLWESLTLDQQKRFKIALAAPTGKAAANLESSIQKALRGVEGFPQLSAQTLHSLLGVSGYRHSQHSISADVLLVDESSMIDVHMMASLLKSLKPGARLIMLGDKHQLPPVEAGTLFSELVEILQESKELSRNVIELKTCLRSELKSIIDLASCVNEGSSFKTLEILEAPLDVSALNFVPLRANQNAKEFQRQLLIYCLPKYFNIEESSQNPLEVLKRFSQFRLLTPLRKGPHGVETLNRLFFEAILARVGHLERLFVPIMIQSNDYRSGLFNGEVGLLVKNRSTSQSFSHKLSQNDYALFIDKSDGKERKIPALLLPKFDYAYCLSIHKSQGSEFDHVLLLLPEGCERFGKEALYTGITRARQKLEIWSNKHTLVKMIECHTQRYSGIKKRFFSDSK